MEIQQATHKKTAMSADHVALDPEKGGMIVIRESRRSDRCWKCLGLFSLLLLAGICTLFVLLHFRVIPSFGPQEPNDLLAEREKAESAKLYETPRLMQLQAMKANKPAAHLHGYYKDGKLTWSDDALEDPDDDDVVLNKMEVQDNQLIVPSGGLYFVYTQVVYTGRSCQKGPLHLTHTVNHLSTEFTKWEPILSASKTACESRGYGEVWFQTLYQGGVFRLNKGDRLSTATSEVAHLFVSSSQAYFGAVAL
ncbi:tumor necrosis factor-like [Rhinatrema bivittatum]|uniref:tumor necrosis factor-like n=1 Tax=Rhinatrema bivittatum TaxID=194408 RepID=UPI00112EC351|nr:tumor necrosis factor-like [Rhinatrema bivittatum]